MHYKKIELSDGWYIWDWDSYPAGLLHGPFEFEFLREL